MLLAIDIGNTNVTIGTFDYAGGVGRLAEHWRLSTHREETSDELGVTLRALFDQAAIDPLRVEDEIISSVVPPTLPIWERVATKLFDRDPLIVGPGIKTGMPVRYENPREVGADRIVNSVAAFEMMGGPVIAVDFGTATTFDCVNAAGDYVGGAIAPGFQISAEALYTRTSKLPRIELERARVAIGTNTVASMQSGLYWGYVGLVDGIASRCKAELGGEPACVATGGLANMVAADSAEIDRVDDLLTLQGLRLLWERNRE
jgi:type III pantothenate kinase